MARILIVVPPLTGHINPALSVAAELLELGHEVRWAVHGQLAQGLLPATAQCLDLPIDKDFMHGLEEKSQRVRGLASVQFLYQDFCLPLARLTLAPLEAMVRSYAPDIMLCDHQMIAGGLVADKLQIPWLTLATTSASILKASQVDVVERWLVAQLHELQLDYGVTTPVARPDFSAHGVIVFSALELVGEGQTLQPARYHFVGPALTHRPQQIAFPWSQLDPGRQKVLISLGTVSRDRGLRFYEVLMEALADLPQQFVMVAPELLCEDAPENFIIQPRVPQLALLPQMTAVICHAGHNTVCESLSHGLPLIVAPIRDDQPVVAQQVVNAGAGLYLRYGKVSVAKARDTVLELLTQDHYRQAAERLAVALRRLGGARQAAQVVETTLMAATPAIH